MSRPDPDAPAHVAVIDDYQGVAAELNGRQRVEPVTLRYMRRHIDSKDPLVNALREADVVVAMRERRPRNVIERLPQLRPIATIGTCNASIDVDAAHEHGVKVRGTTSSPGDRIRAIHRDRESAAPVPKRATGPADHQEVVSIRSPMMVAAFALDYYLSARVFSSEDAKEGPRAFTEKCEPRFQAR